jgi:hypothetical protein
MSGNGEGIRGQDELKFTTSSKSEDNLVDFFLRTRGPKLVFFRQLKTLGKRRRRKKPIEKYQSLFFRTSRSVLDVNCFSYLHSRMENV